MVPTAMICRWMAVSQSLSAEQMATLEEIRDLDEYSIAKMKSAGCKIDAWGVGTKLSTCYDQPALNMIYKLCAINNDY